MPCGRYGFSSTTTDRSKAVHYAKSHPETGEEHKGRHNLSDCSTIFEMQMGMVDRGAVRAQSNARTNLAGEDAPRQNLRGRSRAVSRPAPRTQDLSWLSQYPHEREVLLPPLTGVEAFGTEVEGGTLVVHARLSLNLNGGTLEQVLSRRRKMLMDMTEGFELEVRCFDPSALPFPCAHERRGASRVLSLARSLGRCATRCLKTATARAGGACCRTRTACCRRSASPCSSAACSTARSRTTTSGSTRTTTTRRRCSRRSICSSTWCRLCSTSRASRQAASTS